MLKGISVWAFAPNRPLDEVFKLAKETGFQAVEVAIADDGPITPQSLGSGLQADSGTGGRSENRNQRTGERHGLEISADIAGRGQTAARHRSDKG